MINEYAVAACFPKTSELVDIKKEAEQAAMGRPSSHRMLSLNSTKSSGDEDSIQSITWGRWHSVQSKANKHRCESSRSQERLFKESETEVYQEGERHHCRERVFFSLFLEWVLHRFRVQYTKEEWFQTVFDRSRKALESCI